MQKACRATDYGPEPLITSIPRVAAQNSYFRNALWTGGHLQMTLMTVRDEIGLEMHDNLDQYLRVEEGLGLVKMGKRPDNLNIQQQVGPGSGIFVPAGTWHNIFNRSSRPLKLSSVYAPVQHPHSTVHKTKQEAEAADDHG